MRWGWDGDGVDAALRFRYFSWPRAMSDPMTDPFDRAELLDEPGIVGARWWHKSLVAGDAVNRRAALAGILVATGAIGLVGMVVVAASASGSGSGGSDYRTEPRAALEMQKQFGWSFGATTESLTFDGESHQPFDRAALARIADELRPAVATHAPYYVPTLFQSPAALPRAVPQEDVATVVPLKDALRPIFTPAMDRAYRRGKALASLFKGSVAFAALVVDLPGAESVAFAAGAASVFDPVFLFDNWPHPRGVVPAHLALAAAAYYQPLFARRRAGTGARPMFVLDRARLSPYADEATQFDNRHVARLPGTAPLKQLGVSRLLYVAPTSADTTEMNDLNDDFVLYAGAGVDVKILGADIFAPDPAPSAPVSNPGDDDGAAGWPPYFYGGSAASHLWFWTDYPWVKQPPPRPAGRTRAPDGPVAPSLARPGKDYVPRARATPYSTGAPVASAGPSARPRPSGFGTVPVVIAVATGVILGARLFRNGSWNRASSWGGGG